MKIFIQKEKKSSIPSIKYFLSDQALNNCNFADVDYEILIGEYTYIEDCDAIGEYEATAILGSINRIIEGDYTQA